MTDPTPEVIHALVRLMNGESNVEELPVDDLYALADGILPSKHRVLLARVLTALNDNGETFSKIGGRLKVHEATAARWAKPPGEDRRRRRGPADGEALA